NCAFPLPRRARNNLRLICRDLLLVSQGYRKNDERILGQSTFLALTHLHERDFPPDVSPRNARHAPALVRWWPGPWRGRRSHGLGADWIPVEPTNLVAAWVMALAQIPFVINFFWSIKHGKKVSDNPW